MTDVAGMKRRSLYHPSCIRVLSSAPCLIRPCNQCAHFNQQASLIAVAYLQSLTGYDVKLDQELQLICAGQLPFAHFLDELVGNNVKDYCYSGSFI